MEASSVMGWIVPAALLLLAFCLLYLYGTWTFSIWARHNIPGPKPVAFFGNILEVHEKSMINATQDWSKKYGKTFGIYLMRDPLLLTTDLDILKEVTIKDFANFTHRANIPRRIPNFPANLGLVFVGGDTWRRVRHTMTPTFSTKKLKLMGPYVSRTCSNLSRVLQRHAEKGEPIDAKRVFGAYALETIGAVAFGLESDILSDSSNELLKAVEQIFSKWSAFNLSRMIVSIFPFLHGVLRLFKATEDFEPEFITFIRLIKDLVEDRRKSDENGRLDLLQLLLEAEASENDIAARPQDRQLTKDEILAQAVGMFLAGYDTTATILLYMAYLLSLNPDKQEKLYKELIATVGDAPSTYENVTKIKYLDNVIWETLRCFPPAPMVTRKATEARVIQGIKIDAGSCIGFPICSIMHDKEIFSEPHKFLPERFKDENIPDLIRELPFGAGPRQCIGMRLALYEAKMAAVTVVRQFKFVKVPETPETITFVKFGISKPAGPLLVGIERRK